MKSPWRTPAILMTLLFLSLTGVGLAARYNIDPNHSRVTFRVKHLTISWVNGAFDKFSGNFEFEPNQLQEGTTEATIDATSINTNVARRDDDLRSPNFLDVQNYPEIRFVSKKVLNVQGGTFDLVGDLTLHGVTKEVVLKAELGGTQGKRAAFSASTVISRQDFGITWNRVLDTGAIVVGDDIHIQIDIEGTLAEDTP